ncbi:hypothetical protein PLESTB_000522000 [Pleodorina starrii]|uniref:F-box domain-containing protein n=1 Tax=Pleodorina starrii TaxID=330485 RepID=A0A9W6BGZ8_9CHLO|nr:hypothetical protein PLESTM_000385500 [Pleodorina starrii]GLC51620.1 hypothetical protein PLESTB_000522000 [Pleodorina starrii]
MMDIVFDWAGHMPEPVLLQLATGYLSFPDIKSVALVCRRWSSVLQLCRRKVALLPCARRDHVPGPRPTPAERYPPHLFCQHDTVCVLPLSKPLVDAMDSQDLDTLASVLADYRLPLLHVRHAIDPALALRTRADALQRDLEARFRRAQHQLAAAAAAPWQPRPRPQPPPEPHPLQPYYDLSAPLVHALTSLLSAPQQPGAHLRRLVLHLPSLPQPAALQALALLASLESLRLLGGPAAFLEQGHLDALAALRGLTELALEGAWGGLRRPETARRGLAAAPPPPGGGFAAGAGAWPPPGAPGFGGDGGLAEMAGEDEDGDGGGGGDMGWQAGANFPPAFGGGGPAGLHAGLPGGAGGPAAAAAAAADPDGDDDGDDTWPDLFSSLDRLRVLRLRALGRGDRRGGGGGGGGGGLGWHQHQQPLQLDLHPLTGLQSLTVRGGRLLDVGLSRLGGQLQGLTHLDTDRVLSLAEWQAVRGMEGLAAAALRAEVAGPVLQPLLIGDSVVVPYGGEGGGGGRRRSGQATVSFPMPPELRRARGASGGGGGCAGGARAALEPAAAVPPGGNMFAAAAAMKAAGAEPEMSDAAWSAWVRRRLWDFGQLHVQLEPLRLLSDNTSLTRLDLRWRSAAAAAGRADPWDIAEADRGDDEDGGGGGGGGFHLAPVPVLRWRVEDALLVRRSYVRSLAALSEIQDVELCCPGGELVLDAALLEALAPAWRGLRRFVYTGVVVTGGGCGNLDAALGLFPRLQELGLHDQPSSALSSSSNSSGGVAAAAASSQQQQQQPQPRREKLLLRSERLPAGLLRLSLAHVNVLHTPGAGLRCLQRLHLRSGCRWQGGAPAAASQPAAATSPSTAAAVAAAVAPVPSSPVTPHQSVGSGHAVQAFSQAARPSPASAAAGLSPSSPSSLAAAGPATRPIPRPWLLYGMPLLTHLRLTCLSLEPSELRALVRGCGGQLRSLSLTLPSDPAYVGPLTAELAEVVPSLTKLAHLAIVLRDPPAVNRVGSGGHGGGHQHQHPHHHLHNPHHQQHWPAAAGWLPGGDAVDAAAWEGLGGQAAVAAAAGGGSNDDGALRVRLRAALAPVRRLVEAVVGDAAVLAGPAGAAEPGSAAAAGGSASRRLAHLRELCLDLPWLGLSGLLTAQGNQQEPQEQQPPPQQQQQQQREQQLLGPVLMESLAGLGQLKQLSELRLYGPLVAGGAAEPLERWLLEALPGCHVILDGPLRDS